MLRAEVDAIAARRRGGRRRDRRRRHEGRRARPRRRHVHLHDRPRPPRPARAPVAGRAAARRPDPALRPDRRARHGDHARPRRVRARRRRSSPTPARCGRRSTRCSTPPGPSCAACATRPAAASPRSLNELARASGVAMLVREARGAGPTRRWPAPPSCSGIDPMYVANEGVFVAIVDRPRRPTALAALRAAPGCERGRRDRRGPDRAARHGARRDGLRRPAGDGPARRRPAAEDLLMHELVDRRGLVRDRARHARGRRVERVEVAGRAPAPGRARRARVRLRRSSPRARRPRAPSW